MVVPSALSTALMKILSVSQPLLRLKVNLIAMS